MTLPSFTGNEAFRERSTTLFQLWSNLLSPYDEGGGGRWRFNGDDASISDQRVTSLALLFHKYATSAVKYGSLSAAWPLIILSVPRSLCCAGSPLNSDIGNSQQHMNSSLACLLWAEI